MTPSGSAPMPSTRRRAIPGMTGSAPPAPPAPPVERRPEDPPRDDRAAASQPASTRAAAAAPQPTTSTAARSGGRPVTDYASTRLVNFRLPVALHDRYKRLVRDVEDTYPRLRHPSLTEVLIGLLEEGPDTVDEVAALIRRKRAAEHGTEDQA